MELSAMFWAQINESLKKTKKDYIETMVSRFLFHYRFTPERYCTDDFFC